jgi:hypothetical protein
MRQWGRDDIGTWTKSYRACLQLNKRIPSFWFRYCRGFSFQGQWLPDFCSYSWNLLEALQGLLSRFRHFGSWSAHRIIPYLVWKPWKVLNLSSSPIHDNPLKASHLLFVYFFGSLQWLQMPQLHGFEEWVNHRGINRNNFSNVYKVIIFFFSCIILYFLNQNIHAYENIPY